MPCTYIAVSLVIPGLTADVLLLLLIMLSGVISSADGSSSAMLGGVLMRSSISRLREDERVLRLFLFFAS